MASVVKKSLYGIFYLVNLTVFMLLLLPAVTTTVPWWLDNLLNLQIQWAFLGLLLGLLTFVVQKRLKAATTFLYSAIIIYNLLPLYHSPVQPITEGTPQHLNIAQINLSYNNSNLAQLLPTLADPTFDLLVLQEASDKEFENIKKLTRYYPYSFGINEQEATPSGMAILSRYPIIEKQLHDEGYKSGHILEVLLHLPGLATPIQVYALHPGSPRTKILWQLRNKTLISIAERIVISPFAHKIVVGDFNSAPWSGAFKRLQKNSQLKNSAQGFGYIPSWSYSNNTLLSLLTSAYIDHCLVSTPFKVLNKQAQPIQGSDHQLLLTKLAI